MMQEIMEEVGGDGFLIFNSYFDRRYVMEVCDGLVPELQRRGLTRKAYAHKHFTRQSAGVLERIQPHPEEARSAVSKGGATCQAGSGRLRRRIAAR